MLRLVQRTFLIHSSWFLASQFGDAQENEATTNSTRTFPLRMFSALTAHSQRTKLCC